MTSSLITTWRTSFLTLRDETLTPQTRTSLSNLLHNTIFSHSHHLISAASLIPNHEVTCDLVFLMQLANEGATDDVVDCFAHICHLIYGVTQHVSLELNSSSWALMLESFGKMVELFLGRPGSKREFRGSATSAIRTISECLETLRRLLNVNQRKYSLSEHMKLLRFLLHVIECSHAEVSCLSHSNGYQKCFIDNGKNKPRCNSLWEVQTISFDMIGEIFSRTEPSSIPLDIWQSVLEVIRKIMDAIASKSVLVEDSAMSKFYLSVLNCLHLVLADPKGSLSDHVAGFVASLRMFFIYGLINRTQLAHPRSNNKDKGFSSLNLESKNDRRPYRPPHLRKKDDTNMQQQKVSGHQCSSDNENSPSDFMSSDSDYSDSDGSARDTNNVHCSKVRVAATVCIQDLCQADPKSFSAHWTMLLPTSEVLQPRKHEGNLMTCLLFDPHLKARIASASTLAAMLDGPASVFLQVAEYKESTKSGSFTALSTSLGQILMQLHTGVLHLIQRETHGGLLVSVFKILMLLIQSTPYPRMPAELLPSVIKSLRARIEEGFPFKSDQTSLLAVAFSCLTAALSTSPSSPHVKELLLDELSAGCIEDQVKRGVLFTIFLYSEPVTSISVSLEALQALRAVSHNYPNIMVVCWEKVSAIIHGILRPIPPEHSKRLWKGQDGTSVGLFGEKITIAAIKVLDECLRAISGFKGTGDHLDDRLMDTPFTSDCIRLKKISSAPFHGMENPENTIDKDLAVQSGNEQWCEALTKHMPLILRHTSFMVRAASMTCFAGITSSVFFLLSKEKQDFIIFTLINAAENDEVPSVRSAACRAIGVIACFPQIFQSAAILEKFINVAEVNTRDPLVSVRITSSWALANICDSLRRCINEFPSETFSIESNVSSRLMASLVECALHLTKDNDKIKANAVRALGNLSRLVRCQGLSGVCDMPGESSALFLKCNNTLGLPSSSDSKGWQKKLSHAHQQAPLGDSRWLEKMVQAFLSCVTTGNVKVQWNVCHALSNLFLNETVRLHDVEWAPSVFSILLLLLRDSSNFKIRIQAAAALAVPASIFDYGRSFSDVVQGLEHIIENLGSDKISTPSDIKYRVALEKQLISTMLHVLSLASSTDQPLKDFLVKKALFLEEWFKRLCSSLGEEGTQSETTEINPFAKQKKEMISKAISSLIEVYKSRNQQSIAQKFEILVNRNS